MSEFINIQRKIDVSKDEIGIAWTGQAGFAFKDSQGLVYHVDPYLSNICSQYIGYHRAVEAPVEANAVVADVVFLTHAHRDHLDPVSIPEIYKNNPDIKFVGPTSTIKALIDLGIREENLITINRGEEKNIGNIQAKAVLAYHTEDSVGFIFKFDNINVYITGDTTYSDDLIEAIDEDIDLMMPCINGRLGCMNIPDAARLTAHVQPSTAVPMHVDMFVENTASSQEFVRQAEAYSGLTKGFVMKHGDWYKYNKQGFYDAF